MRSLSQEGGKGESDRIAIIAHNHPSLSRGGAEIAAYTLFQGLRSLGRNVIFVAACPTEERSKLLLSADEFAVYYDPADYDHFYQLGYPSVTEQLLVIIREQKVALANFHHFFRLGLAAIAAVSAEPQVRTVMTLHEFLLICHHHGQMITRPSFLLCDEASPSACTSCFPERTRQQFDLRRESFLKALSKIDRFVSPSHFLANRYIAWGLPEEKVSVVENGLSTTPYPQTRVSSSRKPEFVFGFFGQINPFKGVDTILEAAHIIAREKKLKDRLRIRLHGNVIGQSQAFLDGLHRAVNDYPFLDYRGPYDNKRVLRLMGECDYVLMPSRWWENSPVVIQEAFAAGCPVICTGIGGMAEKVVDGVSGLHFRVNDPVDLVEALRIAADRDLLMRLVAGLPKVSGAERMAEEYLAVFKSAATTSVAQDEYIV